MKYYCATAIIADKENKGELVYKEILAESMYDAETQADKWFNSLDNVVKGDLEVDEI
jgi:hypothetical protein